MIASAVRRKFGSFSLPGGVRLDILNESIVRVDVVCIVNAAKRSLEGGGGVDGAIHAAAGRSLLASCKALPILERGGIRCHTGGAKLTLGPFAPSLVAHHVVHVVGPDLRESRMSIERAEVLLKGAISAALSIANAAGISSLAIPAVSCGVYAAGDAAWMDAAPRHILQACIDFGTTNPPSLTRIVLSDVNTKYCEAWRCAAVALRLPPLDDGTMDSDVDESRVGVPVPDDEGGAAASSAAGSDTHEAAGIPLYFDLAVPAARIAAGGPLCRFIALGDWGFLDDCLTKNLAANMSAWVAAQDPLGRPDFVLALGDNFYSSGVSSVKDAAFKDRWSDVFHKSYPELHLPWCVILGNHDCMDNPQAQIDFTKEDPQRLWHMPARTYGFSCGGVSFFGLDTNGCQFTVQRVDPGAESRLDRDIAALDTALATANPALLKIVFGHHTLYTKGAGHVAEAKCLRLPSYSFVPIGEVEPVERRGFGLEQVLKKGGAAAYFCGHEHVMQAHPSPPGGVATFGVGATCETYFYKGEDRNVANASSWPAWVDPASASLSRARDANVGAAGFTQVDVWADRLVVTFIRNAPLVVHPWHAAAAVAAPGAPSAFHTVVVPLPA